MHKATTAKGLLLGLIAALALTGVACPTKKPKYPLCGNDKDCKEGEFCVNKNCVSCRADNDCEKNEQCVRGACQAKKNWCGGDEDCPADKVCKSNKCVACENDGECGEGGKCNAGKCLRAGMCNSDEDCKENEYCEDGRCKSGPSGPISSGCNLTTVYFEFDAAGLSEEARSALTANADCIKKQNKGVQVIGHTDPRGTEEYNLTLSDRRARAVRDYLVPLVGAVSSKMRVVPKGELEASGADETGWSQDRRVEFQFE